MILTLKATSVAVDCQDGVRLRRRRAQKLLQEASAEPPQDKAAAGVAAEAVAKSSVNVVKAASDISAAAPKGLNGSVLAVEGGLKTGPTAKAATQGGPTAERAVPHALERVPSLAEFLGYSFCCGLHFAGPFYFFGDYKDWAEGKKVCRGSFLGLHRSSSFVSS